MFGFERGSEMQDVLTPLRELRDRFTSCRRLLQITEMPPSSAWPMRTNSRGSGATLSRCTAPGSPQSACSAHSDITIASMPHIMMSWPIWPLAIAIGSVSAHGRSFVARCRPSTFYFRYADEARLRKHLNDLKYYARSARGSDPLKVACIELMNAALAIVSVGEARWRNR